MRAGGEDTQHKCKQGHMIMHACMHAHSERLENNGASLTLYRVLLKLFCPRVHLMSHVM